MHRMLLVSLPDDGDVAVADGIEGPFEDRLALRVKLERELMEFSEEERVEFMAELGVEAAMAFIKSGKKASGYVDTGVQLIAKDSVAGVASLGADKALALCWGDK